MSIASEIARLQAAKVDIMAALVEKGVDVTGKNLVDVPDLIDSIEVRPKTVRIGKHDYPYVKIGNLYWLSENLKEDVGSNKWYGNNQTKYEPLKFGRLYRYEASKNAISSLKEGWRIPTLQDKDDLVNTIGQNYLAYMKEGTNTHGFDGIYSGYVNSIGEEKGEGYSFAFWTSYRLPNYQNSMGTFYDNKNLQAIGYDAFERELSYASFRLCKDA